MKITDIRIRPLTLPLARSCHWTQGLRRQFQVNLIEIALADGTVGLGEAKVAPDQAAGERMFYLKPAVTRPVIWKSCAPGCGWDFSWTPRC